MTKILNYIPAPGERVVYFEGTTAEAGDIKSFAAMERAKSLYLSNLVNLFQRKTGEVINGLNVFEYIMEGREV